MKTINYTAGPALVYEKYTFKNNKLYNKNAII